MKDFFTPYGPVWRVLNFLTDLLGLSVCFFLCCIPVVTIGAATTALYDAAVRGLRFGTTGVYGRFFSTFRTEFKLATAQFLLWGGAALVLSFFASVMGGRGIVSLFYSAAVFVPPVVYVWAAMILSRFSYGFRDLTVTALRLSVGYLPHTIVIFALTVFGLMLVANFPLLIAVAPAGIALMWSFPAEKVFSHYGGSVAMD